MRIIAYDLDNTLIDSREFRWGEDPPNRLLEISVPRNDIVRMAQRHIAEGNEVIVITSRDLSFKDVTLQQIKDLGLKVRIFMQKEYRGLEECIKNKALAIKMTNAGLLIGDLDHLDGAAAREAGIEFLRV